MMATRTLIFLAICTVIVLMVLNYGENANYRQISSGNAVEAPEFIMEQMVTTRYWPDGRIHSRLTSDHVEYYKQSDTATASHPYYILYNDDSYSWHARADFANILKNNEGANLKGNVRVWQPERHLELDTPALFIAPERKYAETDKLVQIRATIGNTEAVGMKLDMNDETLQLLSRVHGTYERP